MSQIDAVDERWLDAAVRFAATGLGTTADNPAVGALVVDPRSDVLVSRAVTARGGRPHAETVALDAAGFDAAGCTLYVTMEPCHHWGRTPPCVDAIIRAGIMRVVIGTTDPRSAGGSVALLESAGIETTVANHEPSIALHSGHQLRLINDRPFVTALLTVSADGMIADENAGRVVAGEVVTQWIELLRSRSDAVMVGGATARTDDPTLKVTIPGLTARSPQRIVLAGADGIDRNVNLIGGFSGYRTAIIAESAAQIDAPASVELLRAKGASGRPDLKAALAVLAGKGIQNLLVEPGQRLTAALLEGELVDRFVLVSTNLTVGDTGLAANDDGPIADVLAAAGLVEVEYQSLGGAKLTIYERPQHIE